MTNFHSMQARAIKHLYINDINYLSSYIGIKDIGLINLYGIKLNMLLAWNQFQNWLLTLVK